MSTMKTMMRNRNESAPQHGWRLTSLTDAALNGAVSSMPAWLGDVHRNAMKRFIERGLPGSKDEHWRQTSLRRIRETTFQFPSTGRTTITEADVRQYGLALEGAVRLVFVNGRFNSKLSDQRALPEGVTIATISEAMIAQPQLMQEHLTKYVSDAHDPFVTLNTALFDEGMVVHVAKDVKTETPIYMLCITTAPDGPIMTHPRNLIVAEPGAHATVIEDYVGTDGQVYLTNAVTELVVGANAHLHHYMVERESDAAFNVSTLTAHHAAHSILSSHTVLLGGALVRNNVNPVIDGEHCHSLLNGLYVGCARQHMDNLMRVEHRQPNGDSRQYYKGILTDEAHGVFAGRIIVSRGAQKTDAVQSNQSLLLSESARANSMPQLEIYADDVKCTHGATIGELDEDALFYLRCRGIGEQQAMAIMVRAFAGESLERMNLPALRSEIERMLMQKLPVGAETPV